MKEDLLSPEQISSEHNLALQSLFEVLKNEFGEDLISFYYYGSLARGDMHVKSDIDTIAIVKGKTNAELRALSEKISTIFSEKFPNQKVDAVCIDETTANRSDWVAIIKKGGVLFGGEDFYLNKEFEENSEIFLNATYKKYFITSPNGLLGRVQKFISDYTFDSKIDENRVVEDTQYFSKTFFRLAIGLAIKRTGDTSLFTHNPEMALSTVGNLLPELREYSEIAWNFRTSEHRNSDPTLLFKLSNGIKMIMDELEPLMKF